MTIIQSKIKTIIKTIGIIGGGQLGQMLCISAQKLGFEVVILDPSTSCPASYHCNHQIVGELSDYESLLKLADSCDVMTFEIEHINTDLLTKLTLETGKNIYPKPSALAIIKNKYAQKSWLKEQNLPVGEFMDIANNSVLKNELKNIGEVFGYPFVVKTKFGGYDGRGNFVVKSLSDIDSVENILGNKDLYAEKFVPFQKELSAIVVKGQNKNKETQGKETQNLANNQIKTYPVVETEQVENIGSTTTAPALLGVDLQEKAKQIAYQTLDKMDAVGVFAIELFLTKDNQILINEIAPRVHNSGHWTMESCHTSQFANHILAIAGQNLGSTEMTVPVCGMYNILGINHQLLENPIEKTIASKSKFYTHNYQKSGIRPNRKMGHINILASSYEELQNGLDEIQRAITSGKN